MDPTKDPTEDEKCVVYGDGSGNSVTGQARIQQVCPVHDKILFMSFSPYVEALGSIAL